MNLVTEKWVPVITMDGQPEYVSLMQVFTEGRKLADLSVRPHERVALMRLFICIAQAALDGPKDKPNWETAPNKLPADAKEYLDKWKGCFNLFDKEKPFLQISELQPLNNKKQSKKKKSVNKNEVDNGTGLTPLSKMDFAMATGANPTLFDHLGLVGAEREYPLQIIPKMLLSFLCFLPGGIMSASQWGNFVDEGKSKEGKPTKGKTNGKDGPCSSESMYHTWIRDENLFNTVCFNLIPLTTIERHYGKNKIGRPVWEQMPKDVNDKKSIENATQTYLGRLVPLSRWIKIVPEKNGMVWSAGRFVFSAFKDNFPREVTATAVLKNKKDKAERILLSAKHDKAIWRELSAIFIKENGGIGGPLVFENPLPQTSFDIHVCALIRSKALIENSIEGVYNVSPYMLCEDGRYLYEKEVKRAEEISSKLGWAIETYRRNIDIGWDERLKQTIAKERGALKAKLRSLAMRSYWTAVEKQRHLLMACVDALGTDGLDAERHAWGKVLHKAARDAYVAACGQETPRQIRAFALGWKKLFAEKKAEEENEETNEEKNMDGGEE